MIHRDLKPGNVMVRPDGTVKVLDFGLARAMTDDSSDAIDPDSPTITLDLTQPGIALGTAGYMAPEQIRGRSIDARCDVFAFGCVLYQMLTGKPAFLGDTAADTMAETLYRDPVNLSMLGIDPPEDLRQFVAQCLEKDPARRFRCGRDLVLALTAIETGVAARRASGRKRVRKLCVCGHSKSLPFCDGSHSGENWTCALETELTAIGFCSSERYQNLTYKLASHYQGALCLPGHSWPVVDRLITIVDGTDLEFPLSAQRSVQARDRIVFVLGIAGGLLQSVFGRSRVVDLGEVEPFAAFRRIRAVLDSGERETSIESAPIPLQSAFVSHAVQDEPTIMPVMSYLRRYFPADLFLCADSIISGADWQNTILTALYDKQCFVALLSEAANVSQFCSFEMGAASATGKPIHLLSLDGSGPPAFVQHIQVMDLPRIVRQKPWLDIQDVLLQTLLHMLG